MFFKKKKLKSYDKTKQKPVIRASICNGEQVAGFLNKENGDFEEVMFLKTPKDLEEFKNLYGITETIEKIY
ncbi:MAG: aspartate dehydrogenase [Lachnospiraceae bacterium]|nr:aspartate dehydrogenase [Lachnospiraceae bacterium]